ncbi:MAG: ABC transporter substrate-binding protein [Gammaproteobacteria bacterium]|nr:MAG: ABC transporter substrate-binding protein [Gammaproteobacteria bacterium]
MRKMLATVMGMFVLMPGLSLGAVMPDQLVRDNTTKIIALLKANREVYEKDRKKLYTMIYREVLPHFDFKVMSRAVLGRHWRRANEDQRKHFSNEFRDLLVRTYATVLLKYTNEKIIYLPFKGKPDDKTAVVRIEVKPAGGGPNIPIHYSFYHKNSSWKVYDVTVDGVSLVTNYRSTYASRIRNEGIDALIASMAKANKTKAGGASKSAKNEARAK